MGVPVIDRVVGGKIVIRLCVDAVGRVAGLGRNEDGSVAAPVSVEGGGGNSFQNENGFDIVRTDIGEAVSQVCSAVLAGIHLGGIIVGYAIYDIERLIVAAEGSIAADEHPAAAIMAGGILCNADARYLSHEGIAQIDIPGLGKEGAVQFC